MSITVRVKVAELITALEKNKAEHEADYLTALDVYYADLQDKLDEMHGDALERKERTDNYSLNMQIPQLESDKYQKYIDMFKMSEDSTIEIDTSDYDQIVRDNWDWVLRSKMLNASYSSRA